MALVSREEFQRRLVESDHDRVCHEYVQRHDMFALECRACGHILSEKKLMYGDFIDRADIICPIRAATYKSIRHPDRLANLAKADQRKEKEQTLEGMLELMRQPGGCTSE